VLLCPVNVLACACRWTLAEFVLVEGAKVNSKCGANKSRTAMYHAVLNNNVDMVELLMKYGKIFDLDFVTGPAQKTNHSHQWVYSLLPPMRTSSISVADWGFALIQCSWKSNTS